MERNCSLNEISDGRFYELNDMVKAGCDDCKGCSSCCQGMGNSLVLDPLDIHRILVNLDYSFEELLVDMGELNLVDGAILPNLRMTGEQERCVFLNKEGRCSIHTFRPGFCRIFPLGRYYEDRSFKYILQVNECIKPGKIKVKVSKWIDTADLKRNQEFVMEWHYFLKEVQAAMMAAEDETLRKKIAMYVLQVFYVTPFSKEGDFYDQFVERLETAKKELSI